jgi:hypothetical protein
MTSVRSDKQRLRDCQPEGFRGLEVDDELKLVLRLDGQFRRLGPPSESCPETPSFLGVASVEDETTVGNELPPAAHRRQPVPRRELGDTGEVSANNRVWHHDEGVRPISKDG